MVKDYVSMEKNNKWYYTENFGTLIYYWKKNYGTMENKL